MPEAAFTYAMLSNIMYTLWDWVILKDPDHRVSWVTIHDVSDDSVPKKIGWVLMRNHSRWNDRTTVEIKQGPVETF